MTRTLGVTGGIGSGKTTVCHLLESLGARVFYADDEGKRLMVDDPKARKEIIRAFGEESYHRDGSLNRKYLADQVFNDDRKIERINQIVHPRVFERFEEERIRAEADGVPLLVHEAALIFEAGGDKHLDAVAVVDAPKNVRIERVTQRDNVSREDVKARMGHQLPPEKLRERADFVIENDGDLKKLRSAVENVYSVLVD